MPSFASTYTYVAKPTEKNTLLRPWENSLFLQNWCKKSPGMGVRGVWLFQHKAHSSNLKQVTFVLYILRFEMTEIFMRIFLLHYLRLLFKFWTHSIVSRKWKGATHRILYFCILPPFVQLNIFTSLVDACTVKKA